MVDGIILVFVFLLLFIAVKGSVKHFKGESACCGGGSGSLNKGEKKLDNPVLEEKEFTIYGMKCKNCSHHVETELNKIDGISAHVDFKSGKAHIKYSRPVSVEDIKNAVFRAGYRM